MECEVCGEDMAHTIFDKMSCIYCGNTQDPEPEQ